MLHKSLLDGLRHDLVGVADLLALAPERTGGQVVRLCGASSAESGIGGRFAALRESSTLPLLKNPST